MEEQESQEEAQFSTGDTFALIGMILFFIFLCVVAAGFIIGQA